MFFLRWSSVFGGRAGLGAKSGWWAPRACGPGARCRSLLSGGDVEGDEPAGGDAAEQVFSGFAGADEHHQQLLLVAGRVAGERRELDGRPAVRAGCLLVRDRELAERDGGDVDEGSLDRAFAGG